MIKRYFAVCITALVALLAGCSAGNADVGAEFTAYAAGSVATESESGKQGVFKTSFKDATEARAHNIGKASNAINGKIVEPGDEFSFNDAVGPTNKARGYMLGKIFVNGKDAKGYGGGVCQVSSTLFNAAEQAGMEITERHQHSKAVGYVKTGRDATTSYGVRDFKFVNNKPYAVQINSAVADEELTVSVEPV